MEEILPDKLRKLMLSECNICSKLVFPEGDVGRGEDKSIEKLHYQILGSAIEHSHIELLGLLLDSGISPNFNSFQSYGIPQPLHVACELGEAQMIQILVNAGADVNTYALSLGKEPKFRSVCSAVEKALYHDDPLLLDILAPNYVVEKSPKRLTLTHLACKTGAVKCLAHILKKNGKDVNVVDKMGMVPISWALYGNVAMLKLLLMYGADANGKNRYGWSVMYRVLHPFSWGLQPNLMNENVLKTVEVLAESGISLDDVAPETSSFQMICCQIRAAFSYARDSCFPYDVEKHHSVVENLAKIILDSLNLTGDVVCGYLHYIFNTEIKLCCEMYAKPLMPKQSLEQIDEFNKVFIPMKAFNAFKNVLFLARNLISIALTATKRNQICDTSNAAKLLEDIVGCIEVNKPNVLKFSCCPWEEITDLLNDMFRLIVLQIWPLPCQPVNVGIVPDEPVYKPIINLLHEVTSHSDQIRLNQNREGPTSNNAKSLESLTRLNILSQTQVPRLKGLQTLLIPQYLKSYLTLKIL